MKNEQFLKEYKRFETRVKKIANSTEDSDRFMSIVRDASKICPILEYERDIIGDLVALRHVIVHKDRDKYLAEINDIAFEKLEKIIRYLEKPPSVKDYFACDVYTVKDSEITDIVIKKMCETGYTHVPVYSKNKFIGVFSETSIFEWLGDNICDGNANFKKRSISIFNMKYLNQPEQNFCDFIGEKTSIFDVQKRFENAISKKQRIGALFITKTGKKDEKISGIVTSWDLPNIKKSLD